MSKLLAIGTAIGLAMGLSACGGGGKDGSEPQYDFLDDVLSHVSITPPPDDMAEPREQFTRISAGIYETEMTTIRLNGSMSFDSLAGCGGHPGLEVTVHNAATGETVGASERVDCSLIFRSGRWQSGRLALEIGSNLLTASASGDTVSITVVRIAEPPTARVIFPEAGSIGVLRTIDEVQVGFSEGMSGSSINSASFIVEDASGAAAPGWVNAYSSSSYSYEYDAARFRPTEPLQFGTTYTARLTTEVTDAHGNALLEEFSWSFTTVADVIPPQRVSVSPGIDSVCGKTYDDVLVRIDKMLDPITVTTNTFVLQDSNGTPVNGTISLSETWQGGHQLAAFEPAQRLDSGASYTAYLKSGITDTAGNPLEPSSWSFDTQLKAEGTWTEFAVPRDLRLMWGSSALWTGTEVIVFGGIELSSSAATEHRYYPALDEWGSMSPHLGLSDRNGHSATWADAEMIVWGGSGSNGEFYNNGGRYDPVADKWTSMSTVNAPSARIRHSAAWTGSELIVWGGRDVKGYLQTGGRYDPVTDTWTPMSTVNAPAARENHSAVSDGERMIVWAGETYDGWSDVVIFPDGAVYDPVSDVWTPLPSQNAPDMTKSTKIPDSVVLAGSSMLVWSPFAGSISTPKYSNHSALVSETRRYDSANEEWLSVVDACESLATPNAVWLDGRMLSWNDDLSKGYAYDEQRDIWHPIADFPGGVMRDPKIIAVGSAVIMWDADSSSGVGYRLEL